MGEMEKQKMSRIIEQKSKNRLKKQGLSVFQHVLYWVALLQGPAGLYWVQKLEL